MMVNQPILIAYATRGGTTQKVAKAIAAAMQKNHLLVEVRPAEQITNPAAYQAVLVGSGTREEKWLPEAVHFVQKHRVALEKLPVIYFLVYSSLLQEFPQRVEEVLAELSEVRRTIEPLEVAIFSRDQQSMPPQMLVNAKQTDGGGWSGWVSIETWATQLGKTLEAVGAT